MARDKMYIARKKIRATSIREALEKEPSTPVEEIFLDAAPREGIVADAVGFRYVKTEEGEDD